MITDYTNGGTPSKAPTHRIIVSEEGVKVERVSTSTKLPKYPSNLFRE